MADVAIGRLRVRGPPGLASRSAFLIEDGCRTALPDSERLILVRRMDLGCARLRRAEQATALRRAYDLALLGARHGGEDGAATANCVWFASRAEARRLLLAALLAGRRPAAWYWRLAVPDWRGQEAEQWLGALARTALDGRGELDLLEIVTLAIESGAVERLLRVLAGPSEAPSGMASRRPTPEEAAPVGDMTKPGEEIIAAAQGDARGAALRLRAMLAPAFADRVDEIVRRIGVGRKPADLLIERMLLRASPSLSLGPVLLRVLIRAYGEQLVSPAPPRPEAGPADPPTHRRDSHALSRKVEPAEEARARAPESHPRRAEQAAPLTPDSPESGAEEAVSAESPLLALAEEAESRAAGLWLAIPSLIRMGFREWLIDRPDRLCDDPGRILLHAIARRHRVPPEDPAVLPLGPAGEEIPEWALVWRTGLDRWLRRRARVRLSDLVWRRGRIRLAGDRLTVRFPPEAADLRLRRRALDVDPGWTDWLGLSLRYSFAETGS